MSGDDKPNTRERLKVLAPGFGKRVGEAVDVLGGAAGAAKALPLGENQIRRIINEETVPSFPAISMLAKKSGYRPEWLAFAEEPARRDGGPDLGALPDETRATPFYWVPELDARAAAGEGVMNAEHPEVKAAFPIPCQIIDHMGLDPTRLRVLQSDGTSMEPDIRHGDHMVIYVGEETLIDGAIYVLSSGDDTLVKQVQLDPTGGLTLISKNAAFPPRPVSAEDRDQLLFAGRVVMTLKRFG
ncbi:MAG: S24 family peptidase [Reyranella sp.]|nr:S24 family peptidase [Reyranella sp.]